MITRRGSRWTPAAGVALSVTVMAMLATTTRSGAATAPASKACSLLTASELETILGVRVTLNEGRAGDVDLCTAQTPTMSVMLRLFTRTDDPSGAKEKAGIAAYKQMGADVDVKTFGPITCVAIVPPPKLAQHGFGTTCSVRKAPMFAVLEVTAKSQKDAVPIEKLHPLAEKMASRF